MIIRELEISDERAFLKARQEWDNSSGFLFFPSYDEKIKFPDYVQLLKDNKQGKELKEGYVPGTSMFSFINGDVAGRVSLRHRLNDFLLNVGGHIGYGVIPRFRGQGVATQLLRAALQEALALKIDRALVTCDENNFASAKVIEKCGGILENIVDTASIGPRKKRYWVQTGVNQ